MSTFWNFNQKIKTDGRIFKEHEKVTETFSKKIQPDLKIKLVGTGMVWWLQIGFIQIRNSIVVTQYPRNSQKQFIFGFIPAVNIENLPKHN